MTQTFNSKIWLPSSSWKDLVFDIVRSLGKETGSSLRIAWTLTWAFRQSKRSGAWQSGWLLTSSSKRVITGVPTTWWIANDNKTKTILMISFLRLNELCAVYFTASTFYTYFSRCKKDHNQEPFHDLYWDYENAFASLRVPKFFRFNDKCTEVKPTLIGYQKQT